MYRLCIAYDWRIDRQIPRLRLLRFGPRSEDNQYRVIAFHNSDL